MRQNLIFTWVRDNQVSKKSHLCRIFHMYMHSLRLVLEEGVSRECCTYVHDDCVLIDASNARCPPCSWACRWCILWCTSFGAWFCPTWTWACSSCSPSIHAQDVFPCQRVPQIVPAWCIPCRQRPFRRVPWQRPSTPVCLCCRLLHL